MRANLARRSMTDSLPSPVGGLNDRDSVADMGKQDALVMDNWFPGTNDCHVRGGCDEWATGFTSTGETLLAYNGPGVSKLFAAAGGSVYDISTSAGGAVGAAVATGLANSRFDYTNFGGAAGNFLVAVNGANLPQFYNGTSWTASGTGYATAITGVTASNFTQVSTWKNRLFFVEKNTLKVWYLGIQAIGGAASALDFAGVAKLGGKLVATASISSSAGASQNDYFVAITSEGECLVYQGDDPAVAAAFSLVGSYRIGRPIANGLASEGGRGMCRFGSNFMVITADGMVNIQDAVNNDVIAERRILNDKIFNSVSADVTAYKANFGWQATLMPIGNKLFINVPTQELVTARQYVMNTITGAWCRYSGWNLTCMAYWQDVLYGFIGNKVYRLDMYRINDLANATFAGNPISATVTTAYQYFGGRGTHKHYKMVRPLLFSVGGISPSININVDFKDSPLSSVSNVSGNQNAKWGPSGGKWGPGGGKWGVESVYTNDWLSVTGWGYCAALKMAVTADQQFCRWQAWDITFERGGLI